MENFEWDHTYARTSNSTAIQSAEKCPESTAVNICGIDEDGDDTPFSLSTNVMTSPVLEELDDYCMEIPFSAPLSTSISSSEPMDIHESFTNDITSKVLEQLEDCFLETPSDPIDDNPPSTSNIIDDQDYVDVSSENESVRTNATKNKSGKKCDFPAIFYKIFHYFL